MDAATFHAMYKKLVEECHELLEQKAKDYAGGDDRLGNFKRLAQIHHLPPERCLLMLMTKHTDAINNAVTRGDGMLDVAGEPIEERVKDVICYHTLLFGLLAERRAADADRRVGS